MNPMNPARAPLQWAYDLRQRERDGERLTIAQREMWRAALGEPPLQRRRTDRQPTTREPA